MNTEFSAAQTRMTFTSNLPSETHDAISAIVNCLADFSPAYVDELCKRVCERRQDRNPTMRDGLRG